MTDILAIDYHYFLFTLENAWKSQCHWNSDTVVLHLGFHNTLLSENQL